MARILIACASEAGRGQLCRLLASSGSPVFRACATGSELRRAVNACDDGVVVWMGALPDCKPDELQWDLGERVQILFIARPAALDACESPEVFRLALPASGQAILGALGMLLQLHRMRLPRRGGAEQAAVEQAKRLLMLRDGLTEPEAHRALQQAAMRRGQKMAECAVALLRAADETQAE